jgi:hypothetical protein
MEAPFPKGAVHERSADTGVEEAMLKTGVSGVVRGIALFGVA